MGKLLNELALFTALATERRRGKRIVTVNGSFDILHAGHVRMLTAAKRLGDVLVVLVNSNESVRAYKGPQRPILPEAERAELVAALGVVDYVALFGDLTPVRILGKIKPHVHAKTVAWGKYCVERGVVETHGGSIRLLRSYPGLSTTAILDRVQREHEQPAPRAIFFDRDKTINTDHVGHTHKREDFEFLRGAIAGLRALSKTDYKLIIVTNQGGIGKGLYTKQDMDRLHHWMIRHLRSRGVRIDAIYHCPHVELDGCTCRKPKIGMLRAAAEDFGLSLAKSWMVGDAERDVLAGRMANTRTVKIGSRLPRGVPVAPHFYARDLKEASKIILREP